MAAAFAALVAAAPASAAPPVTNTNDAGAGSLRAAIIAASPGDTIPVPAGTYTLTSGELAVTKSLTLAGQGAGNTILRTNGTSRVLHTTGASNVIAISDVTVRDGNVVTPGGVVEGGGILNEDASLTLTRVVVTNNHAIADGGAGQSGGIVDGGGIDSTSGPLTVTDSLVADNLASAIGGSGKGGGIVEGGGLASFGPLTLTRTMITANTADARGGQGPSNTNQGGGIADGGGLRIQRNSDAGATVSASTLSGNVADASGGPGAGGGIAQGGGAFLVTNGPDVTATNLTVVGNLARANGGGAIAEAGGLFWGANAPAQAFLTNSTITGNAVAGPDVGTHTSNREGGNAFLGPNDLVRNTIISGGIADPGKENCASAATSLGHNIDSLDQCGFHAAGDQINIDPKLGALQNNGGLVPTQALGANSPALDAGDNAGCPTADARGLARPQGAACDVGAFELEQADLSVTHSPAPTAASSSRDLTYTLAVHNGGTGVAHATSFTDTLPAGTTLVSASATGGGCSGTGPVTCTLGDLAAGATSNVTVVVRAPAPGSFQNAAAVATTTLDRNTANNTSSASATLEPSITLALTKVGISPRTFRLGSRLARLSRKVPTGTTIRFTLPEAARVTLTFRRQVSGRRAGRRCVKPTRSNRRHKACKRYVVAGTLRVNAHSGLNRLRFQGRLSKRRSLKAGRYHVTLVARDSANRVSKPVTRSFRLLPKKR